MKRLFRKKSVIALVFLAVTAITGIADAKLGYDYVDMRIGTGDEGHTIISAARPFGLVKPGPDTEKRRNFLASNIIKGFSQLHISGTGGNAQSATVGVMPTTGPLEVDPRQYQSRFNPDDVVANLDAISFYLEDYDVTTEIAATDRVGFYRVTFPKGKESRVLIDVSHAYNKFRGGEISIVDETTLEGTGKYRGYHGSQFDIAFYIEFSRPFQSSGTWQDKTPMDGKTKASVEGDLGLGAYLNFGDNVAAPVLMKISISYVDIAGARNNMAAELDHWDFEKVKAESREAWTQMLSKIQVEGGAEEQKTAFLYRSLPHDAVAIHAFGCGRTLRGL